MEEKHDTLAVDCLKEIKAQSKRWFIAFITMLLLFFATNIAWLYFWNLPTEETTTTQIETNDNGDANYVDGNETINNGTN
jgi:hypothetical protein